jgi:hypothetical protein
MKVIPEKLLVRMDPADRKRLGKMGTTSAESAANADRRGELADHGQFVNFCQLRGIEYIHANPTQKSTIKKGALDFALGFGGRCLYLEFKKGKSKPTPEQEDTLRRHAAAGNPAFVVRSVSEAIDLCYQHLPLRK